MATVTSFEGLEIWKKAQELAAMIYKLCEVNQKIAKDFFLKIKLKELPSLYQIILQKGLNIITKRIFTVS